MLLYRGVSGSNCLPNLARCSKLWLLSSIPGLLQHQEQQRDGMTPVANSGHAKAASKTPWKTPPPLFADPATPATAAPASGWQDMYDDQDGESFEAAAYCNGAIYSDRNLAVHLRSLPASTSMPTHATSTRHPVMSAMHQHQLVAVVVGPDIVCANVHNLDWARH